ncbi:hypothetical protein ACFX1S_033342 [Malus domestica]
MSLFGLTTNDKEHMARLDAYLETRDVCIAYHERTRKASQEQNQVPTPSELEIDIQNDTAPTNMLQEHILMTTE